MGTRGAVGFVIKGEEKLAYNHFDSYPDGLGVDTLKFLRRWFNDNSDDGLIELSGGTVNPGTGRPLDELRKRAENLQVVSDDVPATPEQIEALEEFTDLDVGGPLPEEGIPWYNLLRLAQGDWSSILRAGYMEDSSLFPLDSLFCEWAYVIDLDAEVLEVYTGFQKYPPEAGRWAGRPTKAEDDANYKEHVAYAKKEGREPWRDKVSQYKAVALVKAYPLAELPSDEAFVAEINALTREDEDE